MKTIFGLVIRGFQPHASKCITIAWANCITFSTPSLKPHPRPDHLSVCPQSTRLATATRGFLFFFFFFIPPLSAPPASRQPRALAPRSGVLPIEELLCFHLLELQELLELLDLGHHARITPPEAIKPLDNSHVLCIMNGRCNQPSRVRQSGPTLL